MKRRWGFLRKSGLQASVIQKALTLDNHDITCQVRALLLFFSLLPPRAPTKRVVREGLSKMQEKKHMLNEERNKETNHASLPISPPCFYKRRENTGHTDDFLQKHYPLKPHPSSNQSFSLTYIARTRVMDKS